VFGAGAPVGPLRPVPAGVAVARGRGVSGGETMITSGLAALRPGQALPRSRVPALRFDEFRRAVVDAVDAGMLALAFFGDAQASSEPVAVYAVLADSARGAFRVGRATLSSDAYPSLTPECPQLHLFERELAEQYGVRPEGHPWFKPVRFHTSYRPGHD